MEQYRNVDGDSGIAAFETGPDYIRVQFSDASVYLYTYGSAGSHSIEEMKRLAVGGDGLNAYINKYARKKYAKKER
ncbi:hypothetical protein JW978_04260 [Candidatus Dojkabacteria bacterium]|nr:hypothetical protein [Candidatus Dojkabacteria bacterium]